MSFESLKKQFEEINDQEAVQKINQFIFTQRFLEELVDNIAAFFEQKENDLESFIKDAAWYSSEWDKDPSVGSFIVVLNDINNTEIDKSERFSGAANSIYSMDKSAPADAYTYFAAISESNRAKQSRKMRLCFAMYQIWCVASDII